MQVLFSKIITLLNTFFKNLKGLKVQKPACPIDFNL